MNGRRSDLNGMIFRSGATSPPPPGSFPVFSAVLPGRAGKTPAGASAAGALIRLMGPVQSAQSRTTTNAGLPGVPSGVRAHRSLLSLTHRLRLGGVPAMPGSAAPTGPGRGWSEWGLPAGLRPQNGADRMHLRFRRRCWSTGSPWGSPALLPCSPSRLPVFRRRFTPAQPWLAGLWASFIWRHLRCHSEQPDSSAPLGDRPAGDPSARPRRYDGKQR